MKVAAIVYDASESQRVDELIGALASELRAGGLNLAGSVQSNPAVANRNRCDILLQDLATGHVIKASQDRGSLASGCRLDSQALEESVGLAAASISPETDLVIINRFGKQESEGRGFRAAIEQAVLLDVPVIVGLNRAHVDSWCEFVGGPPDLLPTNLDAVMQWCVSEVGSGCSCQKSIHICD
jgi:nucleoside-triphosphatase THEP1